MSARPHVPLKPAQFGQQYAGWEPSTHAMVGLGSRLLPDQRVPVADGVTLSADVYTPNEPGHYPAVVSFSAATSSSRKHRRLVIRNG